MLTSKQYRTWAHNELHIWIINTETMYTRAMKIMNSPKLSNEGKARALKRSFGDFHNGTCRVGQYASYRKLVNDLTE